ncbi:MAG: ABC transporter ATP-binding protein [Firmicutes bacterium]|nr:ABC transporter ATP-binding protein [Bacillota bacterium]
MSERRPMRPAGGPMGRGGFEKPKNFKASIKRLVLFLKPQYPAIILALLFSAAATVLSVLAPGYINDITNEIFVAVFGIPIDMGEVGRIGVTLVIFYGATFLLNYVQSFLMAGVNQKTSKRMRGLIAKKINDVPLRYFDSRSYGDVLSRVTNDVDTIGQTLNQSVSTLISSVIMLGGVLIAMFVTRWEMALTALLTVPLGMLLMLLIVGKSQKYFIGQQNYLGELNGKIEETYAGQNVVKAFNAEQKVREDFDQTNRNLFNSAWKSQFLSGLMMPLMTFVSNLGYVAVAVVGVLLFINGRIAEPGIITSFFIYVRLFQNPINQIAQVANTLQSTAAAAERVFEFLDEPEQEDETGKPDAIENVTGRVEFRNVRFGYTPDREIIHNFSAVIEPGQKVAIVGPTGAGKTTMVNLLMRFYEVSGGEILIDGVPVSSVKREAVRSLFGMVLQDTWLFNGTIRENVAYAKRDATDGEIEEACRAANADHFISTFAGGYDMVLDDDTNLSGGQRQLLTIARAMVQDSPMLILDEATSNVDTRTEQLIQDAMDRLTAGRTSFVIAHRLSTIKNADLILVMKDGNIIEQGSHDDLLAADGFYASLYNSQFES